MYNYFKHKQLHFHILFRCIKNTIFAHIKYAYTVIHLKLDQIFTNYSVLQMYTGGLMLLLLLIVTIIIIVIIITSIDYYYYCYYYYY